MSHADNGLTPTRTPDVTGRVVLATADHDSADEATTAELWGLAHAERRGLPVTLVNIFELALTTSYADAVFVPEITDDTARAVAEQRLSQRRDRLASVHPQLEVDSVAMLGHTGAALADVSSRAELVVIGTHGLDGWSGLLLGSTSQYLVTHAKGPVVVVPNELSDDLTAEDPIVLGVDGESDHAATEFAFAEASRQGRPLVAVHSWKRGERWPGAPDLGREPTEEQLDDLLASTLAPVGTRHDGVEVRRQIVRGESDLALLGASARAAMLVLGSHGRGELLSVLFGSTGVRLVGRAACPVVVVPEPKD